MRAYLVLVALAVACGSLREGPLPGTGDGGTKPPAPDASGGDDDDDDDAAADAASDATPPPLREDLACAGANGWYQTGRAAECSSRQLRVVQEISNDTGVPHGGLDVAWSPAGRLGIVLAYGTGGFEEGFLQALTFDTLSSTFTVRADRVIPEDSFQLEGAGARIAPRPDGDFEVLSLTEEQLTGGDVVIRRLPAGQPFLPPSIVFTGADRSAQLGLLVHPDGLVTATAAVANDTGLALVTAQRQPGETAFEPFDENLPYASPGPRGNGNHRLSLDAFGSAHIAYEEGAAPTRSRPLYRRLSTTGWQYPRTVDNPASAGLAGEDVSMVIIGDEKNVVYVRQGRSADDKVLPYAQIVRARWRGASDLIDRTVLVDHLPVGGDADHGLSLLAVRAAAAADASGALHLVYSYVLDQDPDAGSEGQRCRVLYRREAATPAGGVEWLEDDLTPALPCAYQTTPLALTVEPGGRPHIAYFSEAEGVVYATRYDR